MACGIEITSPRLRGALVARFTTISARSAWSRRSLFIGLMTTALSIPVLPALAAKHPIPKHLSAKAFLKSIYGHYVGSSANSAKGVLLGSANSVRAYFTVGMASLINEDRASATKDGEAPVLEADPFVGEANWNISDLAIEVKETGVTAVGTIAFIDSGKRAKVVVELLRSGMIGASLSLSGNPGAYADSIAVRQCATRRAIGAEALPSDCIESIFDKHSSRKGRVISPLILRNSDKAYSDYLPLSMRSLASTLR
jgi:hypothetical protein